MWILQNGRDEVCTTQICTTQTKYNCSKVVSNSLRLYHDLFFLRNSLKSFQDNEHADSIQIVSFVYTFSLTLNFCFSSIDGMFRIHNLTIEDVIVTDSKNHACKHKCVESSSVLKWACMCVILCLSQDDTYLLNSGHLMEDIEIHLGETTLLCF